MHLYNANFLNQNKIAKLLYVSKKNVGISRANIRCVEGVKWVWLNASSSIYGLFVRKFTMTNPNFVNQNKIAKHQ